jgi:hypothetical protein
MLLYNPTDSEMIWLYGGSPYRVPAGKTMEFPENIGNHLLTHLSVRGLTELKHGDDKKVKREEGLGIERNFLRKQISDFRKMNEARTAAGFPPLIPSPGLLEIVGRVEGKESAERLEYSTAETANMMLEQLVKAQVGGQEGFTQAMIQMAEAITSISVQQTEIVKVLANLAEGQTSKESKK